MSPHSSPSSPIICGVPQGSVIGPVFSIYYTTPLSSLISASYMVHILHADDTQLFISFVPKNFSSAINNLQSTITLISAWMSSNYLTLNPSKTEFLLIGLPQQTSKIVNPSLSLPSTKPIMFQQDCKTNLVFIFNFTLSFSNQISSLSSAYHYYIRDLCRIRHTLDFSTATTIATALVQSSLDYCNSLYHSLPVTQLQLFYYHCYYYYYYYYCYYCYECYYYYCYVAVARIFDFEKPNTEA